MPDLPQPVRGRLRRARAKAIRAEIARRLEAGESTTRSGTTWSAATARSRARPGLGCRRAGVGLPVVAVVLAAAGLGLAFRRWRRRPAVDASDEDRAPVDRGPGRPVTDARSAGPADPDAYAALEEQRDFLLRSLDDLERERAAGDIDEDDYGP